MTAIDAALAPAQRIDAAKPRTKCTVKPSGVLVLPMFGRFGLFVRVNGKLKHLETFTREQQAERAAKEMQP